ncbi:MAG: hypothetical protein JSV65_02795 [Armatimonadota bacterium]|nr:MAG: hypothetical protein JSV65_02795 [Armatimonadota bacterium]
MRKVSVPLSILVGLALVLSLVTAQAQVAAPKVKVAPKVSAVPTAKIVKLSTASLQKSLQAMVAKQSWSTAQKQRVVTAFAQLPAGMQQAVVASRDPGIASQLGVASMRFSKDILTRPRFEIKPPHITDVWPDSGDGAPGSWLLIYGIEVNSTCQVWFNGSARTTYYMPWGEDFGECVGCEIPSVSIAHDYDLYLKDTAADRTGNHLNYRVVAPRGWRGLHGWKFANFSEATIPWECFRHYFGANEVEDAGGNHLPAAQAWYDSTYKRVGSGGNCFGMTLSAERFLFWQPWSLFESWWNSHRLPRAWNYDFVNEVHRSVNEHQGAQLEASVMANRQWLLDNQDHNEAWERCRDLIGQLGSKNAPLLSIYGPGWGHCVWPYQTEEVGNERRIRIYDNNVPYAEDEASDTTRVVRINKTTDDLTWGSATRTICRSYADVTPADPHLPTEATEGEAAMMAVVVVDKPARVTQISDEAGRRLYVGDRINTDSKTRIPYAGLFVPDTGITPAPDFPNVYVFGRARNKKLNVQLANARGRRMRAFTPGLVFEVASDADQAGITLDKLVTNQTSLLLAQDIPAQVRTIMRVGPRQQRVIDIKLLDAARGVLFEPKADRSGVNVENRSGSPLRYEIEIRNFQAGTVGSLQLPAQTLTAQTGAVLAPTNWAQLRDVGVELRNLQTGAMIRRETLRRMQ